VILSKNKGENMILENFFQQEKKIDKNANSRG